MGLDGIVLLNDDDDGYDDDGYDDDESDGVSRPLGHYLEQK
jgi:hypothetical protein